MNVHDGLSGVHAYVDPDIESVGMEFGLKASLRLSSIG